jgi:DNA polymerase-4/DNA polymerase V
MFQVQSWPNVILHLDGDAFFASVMQAVYPYLKNKPVVTGRERGIATAVSYQARELGIKRGMRIWEIKKKFPGCVIVDSDYEVYSLFSKKIFAILRKFTPLVEEYSIDEGFADIKGLRRPFNMSYDKIGLAIKNEVESCLGITVSVGISLTKSLAKLASDFQKPSGLVVVDGPSIENFLAKISLKKIWGVGLNTSSYLEKLGLRTALEFAQKSEKFIRTNLTKPFFEIWKELRGEMVYLLNLEPKNTYQSIVRSQTFTPPTNDQELLYAKLLVHVEEAFAKARSLNYQVGQMSLFLKTQNFHYLQKEISFLPTVSYPILVRDKLRKAFEEIYQKKYLYRTTGCSLSKLSDKKTFQPGLFNEKTYEEEKIKKIYPLWEEKKVDFGTCLFDKQKTVFNKKPKIFKIPVLSL